MKTKSLILLTIISFAPSSLFALNSLQTAGIGSVVGAAMGGLIWKSEHNKWKGRARDGKAEPKWYHYVGMGAVGGSAAGMVGKWGIDQKSIYDKNQKIIFEKATRDNDESLVKKFLDQGADVNIRNDDGIPLLMYPIREGKLEVVKLLVEKGRADIEAQDAQGWNPLTLAVYLDNRDIITYLLEKGANPNHQTNRGTSSLMIAAKKIVPELVNLLLDYGADPELTNKGGRNAVDMLFDRKIHRELDPNLSTTQIIERVCFADTQLWHLAEILSKRNRKSQVPSQPEDVTSGLKDELLIEE